MWKGNATNSMIFPLIKVLKKKKKEKEKKKKGNHHYWNY